MDSGMLPLPDGFAEDVNRNKGHFGSLQLKQHRSDDDDDENLRALKLMKSGSFNEESNGSLFQRSGSMVEGDDGQQMLCFSSPSNTKPQQGFYLGRVVAEDASSRYQEFPFFQPNERAQGGSVRSHEGVYGLHRMHGPFSSSQYTELKHQALIYNHLAANVPVPSGLLNPLRKSINPYAFSGLSSGSYVSNSLGWGPFHLGFSGNADPEPGRCRRTDGKKWRCSRDAVPDQKYCERHINRGRHRSRKPVEGQTGQAISGSTQVASFAPSSATLKSSGVASNNLGGTKPPSCKSSLSIDVNPPTDHLVDRTQEPHCPSIIPSGINLVPKDSISSFRRQHNEPNQPVFGLVPSDSLLNPSQNCSLISSQNSDPIMSLGGQDNDDQHAFRHFIHHSPKDQSNQVSIAWPGEIKSDWTQLSMSIPVTSSGFSSSSDSPQQKRLTLSPLRLAGEYDPIQMGLSITNDSTETIPKQSHWLPVSWGSSIGGPLGEVLKNTYNTAGVNISSSPLNLTPEQWDSSPNLGSSPTGVLQNSTFVSLSNSSASSSQQAGGTSKALEAASFHDDILGSTLGSSSRIPSI